jgi:hypothetical protein
MAISCLKTRPCAAGPERQPGLVIFDWETAGWGPSAPDANGFADGDRCRELRVVFGNQAADGNGGSEHLRRFARAGPTFSLVAKLDLGSIDLWTAWLRRRVRRIGGVRAAARSRHA